MPFRNLLIPLSVAAILLLAPPKIVAGPAEPVSTAPPTEADPFQHGTLELQLLDGVEYSQQDTGPLRPNVDYEVTVLRLGYMLDSPHQGGTILRGNDELLLEAEGGAIYQGPGNGLAGLSIVYRRNFLAPGARWVPYISGGGGGVYCDAYHEHPQRALGSPFEFDLEASVGLRYRLSRHVSLDTEVAYRHISNADTADRNLGVNSIGGLVGLSYTF